MQMMETFSYVLHEISSTIFQENNKKNINKLPPADLQDRVTKKKKDY